MGTRCKEIARQLKGAWTTSATGELREAAGELLGDLLCAHQLPSLGAPQGPGRIVVTVGGATVTNWSYDAASNRIVSPERSPTAGLPHHRALRAGLPVSGRAIGRVRREMLAPQRPRGDDRDSGMAIPKSPPDSVQDVLRDPEIQRLLDRPERGASSCRPAGRFRQPQPADGPDRAWSASTWTTRWPIYHQRRIEQLSFDMTLRAAGAAARLPRRDRRSLKYDHEFVMRGLVVDKRHGNIFKMDRFGHVGPRLPRPAAALADERPAALYRERAHPR